MTRARAEAVEENLSATYGALREWITKNKLDFNGDPHMPGVFYSLVDKEAGKIVVLCSTVHLLQNVERSCKNVTGATVSFALVVL